MTKHDHSHRITRNLAVVFAVVCTLASLATAAASGPPRAVLRHEGSGIQNGRLGAYCWGDECTGGATKFPGKVLVPSGERLRIRIGYAKRPTRISLRDYRRVDGDGYAKGSPRRVSTAIEPHERDGNVVAWDVAFRLRGDRHHYLILFAKWRNGDASWGFHVKTDT